MRPDNHSYFDKSQPRLTHLEWDVQVDFDRRVLKCTAVLKFNRSGVVDLDTRDLKIKKVTSAKTGERIRWTIGIADCVLGSRLRLTIPKGVRKVKIEYETTSEATGLQWLDPMQTEGKKHPYLFSQGEAINTRSYLPCQDSPSVRFTFRAVIRNLRGLRTVMGGKSIGFAQSGDEAMDRWEMMKPIPAYLIAFAVGDLVSKEIGPRSIVWAEPEMISKAAWEFAEVETFMKKAEELFGRYRWGTFNILVMPWSFPYGGMENPTLTFVTPSIITGDHSMVDVIIHELLHHWFGNYITNATWPDFWLNEGWTMWGQGRVIEALYGLETELLSTAVFAREFVRDCAAFAQQGQSHLTHLVPDLKGLNPDDTFSRVPYHKGHMFIMALEQAVGRKKFDRFVRKYLKRFAFKSVTTAQFMRFLNTELPGAAEKVGVNAWLHGPDLPANAPVINLPLIHEIETMTLEGRIPKKGIEWSDTAWVLYLELVLRFPSAEVMCVDLDREFALSTRKHTEVRWAFLLLAAEVGYLEVLNEIEKFLGQYGRVKYLKPLFRALIKNETTREFARGLYRRLKETYHPIAQVTIEAVFKQAGVSL